MSFPPWLSARSILRSFAHRRGLTLGVLAVATLSLAVSIAFYTVVVQLLLEEPPVHDPDRLVHLDLSAGDRARLVADDRARLGRIESYFETSATLTGRTTASVQPAFDVGSAGQFDWRLRSAFVTADFNDALGVQPIVGRALAGSVPADGQPRDVLIGYEVWRNRFGLDNSIVGRVLNIPGSIRNMTWRVVGVMPPGFSFPKGVNFWVVSGSPTPLRIPTFARLAPSVSLERVRADVSPLVVTPFRHYARPANAGFSTYFVVAGLGLILTSWLQIGSLLARRTADRSLEFQVRRALGATPSQLYGLIAAESAIVMVVALVIAWWIAPGLIALLVSVLPELLVVEALPHPNLFAFMFASAGAVLGGCAMSAIPLALARRADPTRLVRSDSPARLSRSSRAGRYLYVGQMVSATTLVYLSALVGQSYERLARVDLGFDADRVIGLPIPSLRHSPGQTGLVTVAEGRARTAEAMRRLETNSEILSVASSRVLPIQWPDCEPQLLISRADTIGLGTTGFACTVGSGFFRALNVPLTSGSEPTAAETSIPQALELLAVVNTALARYLESFGDVLNQRIKLTPKLSVRVAGVVPNIKLWRPDDADQPTMFAYAYPDGGSILLVRAAKTADTRQIGGALLQLGRDVWGDLAPREFFLLGDAVSHATADYRGRSLILFLICASTLPIVALGLIGGTVHALAERRTELGVRMAVGLDPDAVRAYVMKQFAAAVGVSVVAGAAVGMIVARSMGSFLFGLTSGDYALAFGVTVVVGLICLGASSVPLRSLDRATISEMLRSSRT